MPVPRDKNFLWLNREGRWLGSYTQGLETGADGALRLRSVPALSAPVDGVSALPVPGGPAGIAVDADGTLYYTDPGANRVRVVNGCDGRSSVLPCAGPGRFDTPRGLVLLPRRRALCIADTGNRRVQVLSPESGELLEVWGETGEFDSPWTVAAGHDGSVYVVDYGNRRVVKRNASGDPQPAFWNNLSAAGIVTRPCDVAVSPKRGPARIYIVDCAAHCVFVVDPEGHPLLKEDGAPLSFGAQQLREPMGIAAIGDAVFVGDNSLRAVLQFDGCEFAGEAVGYQGPVAALADDGKGGLLVHTGSSLAPLTLARAKGYARQGVFWTGAIRPPGDKTVWHDLRAVCDIPAPDAHLDFFFFASNDPSDAPAPPSLDDSARVPFTDPKWRAAAPDITGFFIGGEPALYLWVGAWFSGNGSASASLEQIGLQYNHASYLDLLPAIYRKPGVPKNEDFLLRFLSLFESFNAETGAEIDLVSALFDPAAAPAAYLPWLAGWFGLTLQEDWDEETRRREIAQAFARYAQRGTAAGLRRALKEYAGVDAVIEEPLLYSSWWALPSMPEPCGESAASWENTEKSILGYTTRLAAAEPQGAVLGTTAVLDQSDLIAAEDFGAPLFAETAFQFNVQVYRGQVNCPAALPLVRSVIENEKPAHTAYHLCILEPRMRVGFQARVGIDTIVGGGAPAAMRLGETPGLGAGTSLAGTPAARLGAERSRVGSALIGWS